MKETEIEKQIRANAMISYLCLVKGNINWSDADVILYNQAVKDLGIKT